MKRFWHTCLAVIASATMTAGVANAQNDWNAPSEIGSYQSILSRAGYGNGLPATSGRAVGGSGSAGLLEGGQVNGSGTVNGGVIQGAPAGGSGTVNGGVIQSAPVGGSGTVNGGVIQSAPVGGSGTVNGGFATGGVVTGEVVNGGSVGIPYNGSPASGLVTQPRVVAQPTFAQPTGAVYDGGVGIGGAIDSGYGGYIDSGSCYSGVVGAPVSYIEPSPVFATAAPSVSQVLSGGGGRAANWVVGFSALSFSRDYEDGVRLGENAQGQRLFSDDADDGQFGGYGVDIARRNCNGKGFELRFWALESDSAASLQGPDVRATLPSLIYLDHEPSGRNVADIFYSGSSLNVARSTDINNLEVNLLNNGGYYKTRRGRSAHFELFGGFRWFQFDERLTFSAAGTAQTILPDPQDPQNPQNPQDPQALPTVVGPDFFSFQSQIDNDLVGFQLGCRNEICLTKKLRAFGRVGAGIFNNRVTSQQNFFDQDGVGAVFNEQQNAGQPFGFNDRQDDLAILGELEAGVTAQISQRARLRFGYRALGVAGVALAGDQIPVDFRRAQQRGVNTNGSLLLGGGFVGIEFCH